ncbi:MAG: oligosaccharide flippase family protein, partial [Chitinophagaceae bacterium]
MSKQKLYRRYAWWFDNTELHHDLKGKSIKGGISTSASQMICFGINLLSTFILARSLLPGDFGLIGMVTAFTGFAIIIQDMGLSTAVIQKEKITHRQVSNLFWVNILICIMISLVFILASPLIVALYHHDVRLYPIIISYSIGIGIGGLAIQHNALMSRKMLFTDIAKANIFSTGISVIMGVAAAFLGMGYWALVILSLSGTTFNVLFLWMFCD